MDPGFEAGFRRFAVDHSEALFRTAYLLTGDRHAAEDLVQPAPTKTAARRGSRSSPSSNSRRVGEVRVPVRSP
ncbi:hypothetical protein Pve01_12170 [Planomonospora venezuelensis]|nr:hypothetical protein Pve01_12170 [Planomonospora venezuelensis]